MADITMCKGGKCELKKQCYRFTAKPDDYQSYFVGLPYFGVIHMVDKNGHIIDNPDSKDCVYFWSNKEVTNENKSCKNWRGQTESGQPAID